MKRLFACSSVILLLLSPALSAQDERLVPVFADWIPGSGDDGFTGMDIDGAGNVYATGFSNSSDFAGIDPSPFSTDVSGAFVVKYSPFQDDLLGLSYRAEYLTYLRGDAAPTDIAVDDYGTVYLSGVFFGSTARSGQAAWTATLDRFGQPRQEWVFDGSGLDGFTAVTFCGTDNSHVCLGGSSNSPDLFPSPRYDFGGGDGDGILAVFNAGLQSQVFNTYIGGPGVDFTDDLAAGIYNNDPYLCFSGRSNSPQLASGPWTATYTEPLPDPMYGYGMTGCINVVTREMDLAVIAGGAGDTRFTEIKFLPGGGLGVAGFGDALIPGGEGELGGEHDAAAAWFDMEGNLLRSGVEGGPGNDRYQGIVLDDQGRPTLALYTEQGMTMHGAELPPGAACVNVDPQTGDFAGVEAKGGGPQMEIAGLGWFDDFFHWLFTNDGTPPVGIEEEGPGGADGGLVVEKRDVAFAKIIAEKVPIRPSTTTDDPLLERREPVAAVYEVGNRIEFEIRITNIGDGPATNVQIEDWVSAESSSGLADRTGTIDPELKLLLPNLLNELLEDETVFARVPVEDIPPGETRTARIEAVVTERTSVRGLPEEELSDFRSRVFNSAKITFDRPPDLGRGTTFTSTSIRSFNTGTIMGSVVDKVIPLTAAAKQSRAPFDVYLNDELIFDDLEPGQPSGLRPVALPSVRPTVDLVNGTDPDNSNPLATYTVDLLNTQEDSTMLSSSNVLVFTGSPVDSLGVVVQRNVRAVPVDSSQVEFSLIHAAPGAAPVNLDLLDPRTSLAQNLTFGASTPYVALDPGVYTLEISAPGGSQLEAFRLDLTDRQNQAFTLSLGLADSSSASSMFDLTVFDADGAKLDPIVATDGEPEATLPTAYALHANYPNPFNPTTRIHYALPQAGMVHVSVYNVFGQHVATLVRTEQNAGTHATTWDGRNADGMPVASGVYLYRIEAGDFVQIRKMLLVK